MTKKNKRRGFTVVELVIVIAVIAILAAVLIPTYVNLVKKANEAKAQAEAKNLITEMLADILLGKEGDADLLVFSEKGSDVYAYAYSRTEGKIIAYKNNPTAKTGSFEDTVQSILTAMGDAITDCNVAEDDWRHPNKIKAVVNELNTKGTMIVYANYTINADKFAVHVHSFGAWENADAENHIRRCSCGETETAKHEWESKTENNVKIDTCKVCHATKTEVISDGEKHHLFHHIAKAATCGEAGNIEYWECVDEGCGKYFSDSNATNEITDKNSVKIAQLTNHTYGAWNNTTQATCTTAGSKQRTCTVCGHTEDGTIPATGHTSSDWIVDKEPAVGAAGSKHKECTVCHTRLETAEIPALPAPEKTAIEKANEAIKKSGYAGESITKALAAIGGLDVDTLVYKENGEVVATKTYAYDPAKKEFIVVDLADTANLSSDLVYVVNTDTAINKKMTKIYINTAKDNAIARANFVSGKYFKAAFTMVEIGGSVAKVGSLDDFAKNSCFYGSKTIQKVYIGSSVKEIGVQTFGNITSLNYIYYNAGVETASNLGKSNGDTRQFKDSGTSVTLVYGKDVKVIPSLFGGDSNDGKQVSSVMFEDGIKYTEILDYAFYNFTCLTEITLPSSCKTIGSTKVFECQNYQSKLNKVVWNGEKITVGDTVYYEGANLNQGSPANLAYYLVRKTAARDNVLSLVVGNTIYKATNFGGYIANGVRVPENIKVEVYENGVVSKTYEYKTSTELQEKTTN